MHPLDRTGSMPLVRDYSPRNMRRFAIAFGFGDRDFLHWDDLNEAIGLDPFEKSIYDLLFCKITEKFDLPENQHQNKWESLAEKLGIKKIVSTYQIIDCFCEQEFGTSVQTEGYE